MQQLPCYGDERVAAYCAFCGGATGTRDHCPSRILLDDPLPENLPVVPACAACNSSFSSHEEYFACLVSCALAGSTEPENMHRAKTKRILKEKPLLRAKIENSRSVSQSGVLFVPEQERVLAVVTKLAQGHALHELHVSCARKPDEVRCIPLSLLTQAQRESFEQPEFANGWPEVGSRAMQRMLIVGNDVTPGEWITVQPARYRYHASQIGGVEVRIVIHEYLACHVHWAH